MQNYKEDLFLFLNKEALKDRRVDWNDPVCIEQKFHKQFKYPTNGEQKQWKRKP